MKRISVVLTLCVLMLGTLVSHAADRVTLTDLAQYAPHDALFFAGIRADDAFIQQLAVLVDDLNDRDILDLNDGGIEQIFDQFGGYEEVREWLGQTVAAWIQNENISVLALSITNSQSARETVENSLPRRGFTITDMREGTLITQTAERVNTYYIAQRYMLIIPGQELDEEEFADLALNIRPLNTDEDFTDTLDSLPRTDYNAMGYLNTPAILAQADEFTQDHLVPIMGRTAFGLTLIDNNFVVDFAQGIADDSTIAPLINRSPVNMDFAQNLPADVQFLIQTTQVETLRAFVFGAIKQLGQRFDEQFEASELRPAEQTNIFIDDSITFIELAFQGMSGVSMPEAFGWLDEDVALYLRVTAPDEIPSVQFGLTASNTDSAQASVFMEAIQQFSRDLGLAYTRDGSTMTYSSLRDVLVEATELNNQPIMFDTDLLSFVLGYNDNVVSFGTETMTNAILSADMQSLGDTPEFENASSLVLDDANLFLFVNPDGLETLDLPNGQNEVLKNLESLSGSMNYSNGVVQLRLVMTLTQRN
jgi:hypothetical protein